MSNPRIPTRPPGHPVIITATYAEIKALRDERYTWPAIAKKLKISRSSALRIFRNGSLSVR
jgi:hypothetical protein